MSLLRHRPFGLSRRILLVFLLVAGFCLVQIAWWISFQVRISDKDIADRLDHLQHERDLAIDLITRTVETHDAALPGIPAELLERWFPDLEWISGAPGESRLAEFYPYGRVAPRKELVDKLYETRRKRLRMFFAEGVFFLIAMMIGVYIIFRTLRREVGLKRQQSNFVSAVTHELKSPLASIRLMAETMELRELPRDKQTRYLGAIRTDVDRLETLVANLLTVARLESGRSVLDPARADLGRDVAEMLRSFEENLQQRGAMLTVDVPDEPVPVRTDGHALAAVLRNLVENAVKYSPEAEARVTVRVSRDGDRGVLEVRDEGIGLDPFERERIFDKFYRVGDEMVRQKEGSGLGLYIVRALVRQMQGKVSAESEGLGKGTTIRVTLPLAEENVL